MKRVCEYIKNLAAEKHLSHASLARKTSIIDSRLNRFFSGNGSNFSLDEVYSLCLALGTNLVSVLINSGYVRNQDLETFQACPLDISGLTVEDINELRNLVEYKRKVRDRND